MSKKTLTGVDYISLDYDSFKELMLQELSLRMSEYTDRSESDAGIVILELFAVGLDVLSYYIDATARESFLITAEQRHNVLKKCKMLGYAPKNATPAQFQQVFTLTAPLLNPFVIRAGTVVKTQDSIAEQVRTFETQEDLIIPAGAWGNETENGVYKYTVPVLEGMTVYDEVVGSSSGAINQSFILKYAPVIFDSINLFVDSGNGFELWELVENFLDSDEMSKHFVVEMDEFEYAHIHFGDGMFGAIPPVSVNNIVCTYRVGGGTAGNVSANEINSLGTNIAGVSGTFNPEEAEIEGTDSESLESIKKNAVASSRTIWGALVLEDFSEVVRATFPKIIDVDTVQDSINPKNITIHVLTKEGDFTPTFSEEISELFDPNKGGRRIVGSGTITVADVVFQPLEFSVLLYVYEDYKRSEVLTDLTTYVTSLFARGEVMFEEEIYLTELSQKIEENVGGVKAIKLTPTSGVTDLNSIVLTPDKGKIFSFDGFSAISYVGGIE